MGEEIQLFTQNDTGEYETYTPPAFQESIPEDLRDNELFKEIADTGQLATKYHELHSAQPQRPENPEGYLIDVPEGFPIVENDLNAFKKTAYDMKLTPEQFKGVMGHYFEREKAAMESVREEIKKHREESIDTMKMEYGDAYEEKVNRSAAFIRAIGGKMGEGKTDAFNKWLDDTKFGDDPMVIRLFSVAADLISEDLLVTGNEGGGGDTRPVGEDGRAILKFKDMPSPA